MVFRACLLPMIEEAQPITMAPMAGASPLVSGTWSLRITRRYCPYSCFKGVGALTHCFIKMDFGHCPMGLLLLWWSTFHQFHWPRPLLLYQDIWFLGYRNSVTRDDSKRGVWSWDQKQLPCTLVKGHTSRVWVRIWPGTLIERNDLWTWLKGNDPGKANKGHVLSKLLKDMLLEM